MDEALWVAKYASTLKNDGLLYTAVVIHAAAEHFHELILAVVGHLTEQEADWVEPSVTELEEELARLKKRPRSTQTVYKLKREHAGTSDPAFLLGPTRKIFVGYSDT